MERNRISQSIVFISLLFLLRCAFAAPDQELQYLKNGYPGMIQEVTTSAILWKDGTSTTVTGSSSLLGQFASLFHRGNGFRSISIKDLQCDSYESFFRKMYGNSLSEVKKNLVTVYWMPKAFGHRYPMRVTRVNEVDKKLQRISAALEKLPPSYYRYLDHPGGSFYWRNVKREKYLSAHSFGIALDINSHYGSYWLWDREKYHRFGLKLHYHNNIPKQIVDIFEREGFLWGGRWYFYDTMHFEYRPELFSQQANGKRAYNNLLGQRCEF